MPLPRLPTHYRRQICCCRATAGRGLSIDERRTDLPFHTEPLRWETQTRFLRELWLAHSRVLKNKMNPHSSPASWQGASMIRTGFVRRWISSHQMRSRGIKWILRFQNTRSTRRWRKTADSAESPAKKIVPIGLAGSSCSYEYRNNDR